MRTTVKDIIRKSYFHLIIVFVLCVYLLKTGVLAAWQLNFLLFALIIGAFGVTLSGKKHTVHLPVGLVYAALAVALVIRILPYMTSTVPLGYDPGWHKYAFEHPFDDEWTKSVFPLPFLAVMAALTKLLGSAVVLVPLFIALSASTSYILYTVVRKLFNHNAGVIAALLFAVSITQFETFWYNYYKNVLGIIALLAALLFIDDNKRLNWKLIVSGIVVGGIHQPALFIFGLTYIALVLARIRTWRTKAFHFMLANGALIVLGVALTNIDRLFTLYVPQLISAITLDGGAGTFFNARTYSLYALAFIPFALTGFLQSWKKHVPTAIAATVTTVMVLAQFFFHNRFIIYLSIFVIIYAALGLLVLLQEQLMYGHIVLWGFLGLSLVLLALHAYNSKPLISEEEFSDIKSINAVAEQDATVVSTDRYYSPWLKGYVERPILAPGLFDEDNKTKQEWKEFLGGKNRQGFLSNSTHYIYVGAKQQQYTFNDTCIELQLRTAKLYRCA